MAHFIGYTQGGRGQASRLGHKNTGVWAEANGWHIGGSVSCHYNEQEDQDYVTISITGGSNSSTKHFTLTLSQEQLKQINEQFMASKVLWIPTKAVDNAEIIP